MPSPSELQSYCDELLNVGAFADFCPNGLQVEGGRRIQRLVSGVTASLALIEAAIAWEADGILVHHGWFWKGEAPTLTGMKGRRVRKMIQGDLSLLAYHLPLDAHPELGNNRRLGEVLGFQNLRPTSAGNGLVWKGDLREPVPGRTLAMQIGQALGRIPGHIGVLERPLRAIAWCTGGAQGFIEEAASLGVDAYLSGEWSEQTTHQARELGLEYFSAGHHATERYGVQALGARIASDFGIQHRFIEIENPA